MNLEKINDFGLIQLSEIEQKNIEGGSEVTDAIWYGIGYVGGTIYSVWKNGGGSGAYHDAMSSSNHGGIR